MAFSPTTVTFNYVFVVKVCCASLPQSVFIVLWILIIKYTFHILKVIMHAHKTLVAIINAAVSKLQL